MPIGSLGPGEERAWTEDDSTAQPSSGPRTGSTWRRGGTHPLASSMLRRISSPFSVEQAVTNVYEMTDEVRLLGLYCHFFPEEYAATKAEKVRPLNVPFSEAEIEFMLLVHSRLFALQGFFWEGESWQPEERSMSIDILIGEVGLPGMLHQCNLGIFSLAGRS